MLLVILVLFPGTQFAGITHCQLFNLTKYPYKCACKIDGIRFFIVIWSQSCYIIGRKLQVVKMNIPDIDLVYCDSIFDGELVKTHDGKLRYYIFDSLMVSGENMMTDHFSERLKKSTNVVSYLNKLISNINLEFFIQDFRPIDQVLVQLEKMRELPFDVDGLIFMPENLAYITKFTNKVFKWKGRDTLDLTVRVESTTPPKIGLYSYQKGNELVFFRYSDDPVLLTKEGSIVECYFDHGIWKFYRDRKDKLSPNIDWVTEKGDLDARNPVTRDDLLNFLSKKPSSYHSTSPRHSNYNSPTNTYQKKREPPSILEYPVNKKPFH